MLRHHIAEIQNHAGNKCEIYKKKRWGINLIFFLGILKNRLSYILVIFECNTNYNSGFRKQYEVILESPLFF